jgi:hypothetical protein
MTRSFVVALALAGAAVLALSASPAAAQPTANPPAVAGPATAPPLPPFLAPAQSGGGVTAPMSPAALPNGARFMDVDWDCVSACQDGYLECSRSCSACDQCSCQLAYCDASCGIPFQGC